MKINAKQLRKFLESFDFVKPFDSQVPKDLLFNISSGKDASDPVKKLLLNIE